MSFFDAYDIRARIAPAFIVTSPFLLLLGAFEPQMLSSLLASSAAVLIFLVMLYVFSFAVRHAGRKHEKKLWDSWGGPPSAVVLSESDTTFSLQTKQDICDALASAMGIQETRQPGWRQDTIRVQQVFGQVRQYIRQHNPKGLWDIHNAEYGFLRNLYGSWQLWLANSVLSTALCGILWFTQGGEHLLWLAIAGLAFSVTSVAVRIAVLPKAVRTAAFRYAESAWLSFLTATKSQESTTRS